jgi:hypothetical protein
VEKIAECSHTTPSAEEVGGIGVFVNLFKYSRSKLINPKPIAVDVLSRTIQWFHLSLSGLVL